MIFPTVAFICYHTADFEAFEFFPDEYSEAMAELEAEKAQEEGGGLLETE